MAFVARNLGRRLGPTARCLLRCSREEQPQTWFKHGCYAERPGETSGRPYTFSGAVLFSARHAATGTGANVGSTHKDKGDAPAEDGDHTLVVDRSGLCPPKEHSHGPIQTKEEETPLTRHLKTLIRFRGGPITVAEYMDEALTNPSAGFYMTRDVFGTRGDFVTSPEISQMFGELVGVWAMCTWQQMGCPPHVRLVELGPGRGTLMADLLRGTAKFTPFAKSLSVHLVECSPTLRDIQRKALLCLPPVTPQTPPQTAPAAPEPEARSAAEPAEPAPAESSGSGSVEGMSGISGAPLTWHMALEDVPRGAPTIIVAHEFFDALPVHQFQRTERGWCERLVDVDDDPESAHHLRFVLSPHPTAAAGLFLSMRLGWEKERGGAKQGVVEVSPGALRVSREIAKRVGEDGGAALVVDYGQDSLVADSLQAIREHKFVGLLDRPGTADLSVYVDFAAIRHMVQHSKAGAVAHGPISQAELLGKLGINARLEGLLKNATEEQADALWSGYWRLVGDGRMVSDENEEQTPSVHAEGIDPAAVEMPPGMGQRYKAMAIVNEKLGSPICFGT